MTDLAFKSNLHGYLRDARETLVWKLDGLGEYDLRRPMTPTGTNLLGLIKHMCATSARCSREPGAPSLPWRSAGIEPNADFWATADKTRHNIVAICRQAWAFADATISDLSLDAVGHVPWWSDSAVTLHHILVHVTADTQRHAGHADIVRELIDGSAGLLEGNDTPRSSPEWRPLAVDHGHWR